jgi:hypothetical protein
LSAAQLLVFKNSMAAPKLLPLSAAIRIFNFGLRTGSGLTQCARSMISSY